MMMAISGRRSYGWPLSGIGSNARLIFIVSSGGTGEPTASDHTPLLDRASPRDHNILLECTHRFAVQGGGFYERCELLLLGCSQGSAILTRKGMANHVRMTTTPAATSAASRTCGTFGPSTGATIARIGMLTSHTAIQLSKAIFQRGGMGS
jgi:hypothetical protein